MNKIVLVSDNQNTKDEITKLAAESSFEPIFVTEREEIEDAVKNMLSGVFIFDCDSVNIDCISILRHLKLSMQSNDIRTIAILPEKNINYDVLK